MRLIFNLKKFNATYLQQPDTFTMISLSSLRRMILPNDFLVSIDLQDAYLHVPIASEFQKYLRFEYQGIHYQWAALPFGISTAPCIFTRIMKTVVEWLHRQAIRVAFYLDDGLQAHQFTEALQEELATTLSLLRYLGWIVNFQKSDLVPTRDLQYIGIRFQTGVNLVMVPQDRWDTIVSSVRRLLHAPASVHTWQEVLGLLTSAQDLTRRGRLQLRPLEFPNLLVPLPAQLRCHLEWWLQPSNVCEGVFMSEPPFILHLFVDASLEGWGAHFGDDQAAGLWSPVEKVLHINCLEMEAVIRAVEFWKLRLRRKRLMIQSDNSTVVHCVNKQGTTRSAALLDRTFRFFALVDDLDMGVRAYHIPGAKNVIADALSRPSRPSPTEWITIRQSFIC
ncbi:uncharacterized protein LOC125373303 [Haliotis rufescens]|uniref:uncharacterized protein LOC125373303 n=1 Tax=Haliotis rufescens TaxID=6454 RepID=UPI00201E99F5|nr:uncharacterized protein LOC125373303 [Haliotis rufescens]